MRVLLPAETSLSRRLHLGSLHAVAIVSIFAIGVFVYGLFIPWLGFYWDDWPVVWVYNSLGIRGLITYFAQERPVAGWMYALFAPILGISPFGWHTLALVIRCASSAVLFVAFERLWPKQRAVAWLIAITVLLYPGFTQQSTGLNYIEQHLSFFLFVLSLATTIFSLTRSTHRWLLTVIALVAEVLSFLIIELFAGLELFRLAVIIFLTKGEGAKQTLRKAMIAWSPYAVVWMFFVLWRTFLFRVASTFAYKDVQFDMTSLSRNPLHELLGRFSTGVHNILMSAVIAWVRPFNPELVTLNSRSFHSWLVATAVVAIALYTLHRLRGDESDCGGPTEDPDGFPKNALLLGLFGLAVAGLPLSVPQLSVDFGGQPSFADRYTHAFMLPASVTLSSLLLFFCRRGWPRVVLIALTIFAASAYQVQCDSVYRQNWLAQRSIFWQLAWRAPGLRPRTSVFVQGLPTSIYGNHSAGLLNLLYKRGDSNGNLDYYIFDLSRFSIDKASWGDSSLTYKPGQTIVGRLRSFEFYGTTSQSLVAWVSPTGTFRVVSPPYEHEILQCSALCFNLSAISEPKQVISDAGELPAGPLLKILGPEPKHEWLYFYQKAELKRQLEDWGAVADLGDQAITKGYKPTDPSEWFPFIEGYARTHRYETAVRLSDDVLKDSPDAMAPLSALWLRAKPEDPQNAEKMTVALRTLANRLMF